jgi:pimeloyl-ACP methyl ester carboxylesterase
MMSNFDVDTSTSPLVLLHGLAMSGSAWREVIPLVADHHRVHAPTADGHRGGPGVHRRPATMTDMVEAAERYLNDCGLDRPHLAGNSVGAYVAIELARRGRAATVCAFSPVGFWTPGDGYQKRAFGRLQRGVTMGRVARPLLPLVYKSATLRRIIFRDIASRGDRISAARALEINDDGIECTVLADLCADLRGPYWRITGFDPIPCPITIAWGLKETLLPSGAHGRNERIPQASICHLPDVGHVPMLDDPQLVAHTILAVTGAVRGQP